jgi:hypothetical protein
MCNRQTRIRLQNECIEDDYGDPFVLVTDCTALIILMRSILITIRIPFIVDMHILYIPFHYTGYYFFQVMNIFLDSFLCRTSTECYLVSAFALQILRNEPSIDQLPQC